MTTAETPIRSEFLTSRELATLLRTSVGSLRNARSKGLLPLPIAVPGVGLRWRRADIDCWLHAHQEPA